jgi:hypothetical protein
VNKLGNEYRRRPMPVTEYVILICKEQYSVYERNTVQFLIVFLQIFKFTFVYSFDKWHVTISESYDSVSYVTY